MAVGGVVVGALTAGIGLVPYVTVVGLTAASAGGAVAFQYRKPSDSRLILSSDNLDDAMAWKLCVEAEVAKLERQVMPMLPASVDPNVISSILGMGQGSVAGWKKVGFIEDVRVLELVGKGHAETTKDTNNRTRRAQIVINSTPINIFLALMEVPSPYWPRSGNVRVSRVLDDHADELEVDLLYNEKMVTLNLSRYAANYFRVFPTMSHTLTSS